MHCVDTVGKKVAFIQQVVLALKLPNLRGIHARVESLTDRYQVVSSRAFASLADFTAWSVAALAEDGIWMAMKGKHPDDEIAALPADVKVFHVEQLKVPGLTAQRCICLLYTSMPARQNARPVGNRACGHCQPDRCRWFSEYGSSAAGSWLLEPLR